MRKRTFGLVLLLVGLAAAASAQDAPPSAEPPVAAPPPSEDAPTRTTDAVPEGQPRYLAAMRTELEHMGIEGFACQAMDAQRASCDLTLRGATSHRDFRVRIAYSDRTDTVFVYVEQFLTAPQDAPTTSALMLRMMELNWQMLIGKFEWDPTDGEVRLTITLNTDSNFDRRAFRSSIRAIGQLADRYHAELSRIQTPTE